MKVHCCAERRVVDPVKPCPHLAAFKTQSVAGGNLFESFHAVLQLLYSVKMRILPQVAPLRCFGCGEMGGRLHVCAQCVHTGCFDGGHMKSHAAKTNHLLAVDATHLQLFCFGCNDYIYDYDFEHVSQCERAQAIATQQAIFAASETRATYKEWTAGPQEAQILAKESKRFSQFSSPTSSPSLMSSSSSVPLNSSASSLPTTPTTGRRSKGSSRSTADHENATSLGMGDVAPPAHLLVGLRGLVNLGNTCFMNTILQSFLHNPLMRNYFLSDFHNKAYCKRHQQGTFHTNGDGSVTRNGDVCLACELDNIFSQMFAPPTASPANSSKSSEKTNGSGATSSPITPRQKQSSNTNGQAQPPTTTAQQPGAPAVQQSQPQQLQFQMQQFQPQPQQGKQSKQQGQQQQGQLQFQLQQGQIQLQTITPQQQQQQPAASSTKQKGQSQLQFQGQYQFQAQMPPTQTSSSQQSAPSSASNGVAVNPCPPYIPHLFLYGIWKHTDYLAGYEQQDAHEFLISALNGIHNHSGGTTHDCRCIVHRIFAGELRSDVTCSNCGMTSTACDPFFDISLDIPKHANNGNADDHPPCSLRDCLLKFTQPEKLEGKEGFYCNNCKSYQESFKQLSMKKLPAVICFHLKRFEQIPGANPATTSKIETPIGFPEELDMFPYLSSTILKKRYRPNNKLVVTENDYKQELYELFCVVNHHGKMDNGHYTCFVRQQGNLWIKCDDAFLYKTSLKSVLSSSGYLLFYVRKTLEYDRTE